ncbi:hypothetical protein BFP70_19345 [Thioclava sp. SK-1]|uniref:hypothetical protein n=1 Tax=Thioclava sp. SK-1 TaxID=1889770 RepID=UPI0008242EE6|nr:hypothetical protein [Thioclava sp. SK-1]OCX57383.1 hypothetical protein BFP70_19345 [Thioclava sp. SK-1]
MSTFNWNTPGIPETILADNAREFQSRAQKLAIIECAATMQQAPRGSIEHFFAEVARAGTIPLQQANSPKA